MARYQERWTDDYRPLERTRRLNVRITVAEAERFERAAQEKGITVARWTVRTLLAASEGFANQPTSEPARRRL